jgi:hypothetical protein
VFLCSEMARFFTAGRRGKLQDRSGTWATPRGGFLQARGCLSTARAANCAQCAGRRAGAGSQLVNICDFLKK